MSDVIKSKLHESLKKHIKKAEISRYTHGELREKMRTKHRIIQITITFLSLSLNVAVVFFYREISPNNTREYLVLCIAVIPLLIVFTQSINVIWAWTERERQHEIAVYVWGKWIREANFLEEDLSHLSDDDVKSKVEEMDKKYLICMGKTPLISSKDFLQNKANFKKHVTLSKKIDNAE